MAQQACPPSAAPPRLPHACMCAVLRMPVRQSARTARERVRVGMHACQRGMSARPMSATATVRRSRCRVDGDAWRRRGRSTAGGACRTRVVGSSAVHWACRRRAVRHVCRPLSVRPASAHLGACTHACARAGETSPTAGAVNETPTPHQTRQYAARRIPRGQAADPRGAPLGALDVRHGRARPMPSNHVACMRPATSHACMQYTRTPAAPDVRGAVARRTMADPHRLAVAGLPLWVYGWADAAGTFRNGAPAAGAAR